MIQNFTPNDILIFHSGELQQEESQLLSLAISNSEDLAEFENSLSQLESFMDEVLMEPSDLPMKGIMAFAKAASEGKLDLDNPGLRQAPLR